MRYLIFYSFLLIISCSRQVDSNNAPIPDLASIEAIQIDSGFFLGPCEPTICINPANPDNVIAGSVLDNVYVSNDGGKSWTKNAMESSYGVFGDPVIRIDNEGRIYYAHLSNPTGRAYADPEFLDRIVIQRSDDKGLNWTDGSFTLPRTPKDQDKEWLAIDPDDHTVYISWTEFDLYSSKDPNDKSRILFSKSGDLGDSWTYPVVLSQLEGNCLDDDQTTEGAVPAVGPEGQIYVAWSYDENIYFDRSYDKGESWMKEDILVSDQPGGWTYDIPGIMRCNGMPICAVDRSSGPHKGTVYINWSDQRNGTDDTDIWLSRSTDDGTSWSDPVRVNDDLPGKHQFFCWMDIDQSTGYIYIVFYDRRNFDDETTDVFLAYSSDGGKSFKNTKINKSSFKPNNAVFFGDYNDISAHEGRVRPIWTQLDGPKLSVWTALIN